MKKILLVCDGNNFPEGALEVIKLINEKSLIEATGIFLSSVEYAYIWYSDDFNPNSILKGFIEEEKLNMEKSIQHFKTLCIKNTINYKIHFNDDFIISAMEKESRFADLMVMSSELFYKTLSDHQPNTITKNILHYAECPVLLVPEKMEKIEKIILSFDGSENSVFAIKQFVYLLPEFCNLETYLVYADDKIDFTPDIKAISEFASLHFSNLKIEKLDFNPKKHFSIWASEEKNAMLVSGAFSRSSFSRLLKKSFINDVISDHDIPVFVAHT